MSSSLDSERSNPVHAAAGVVTGLAHAFRGSDGFVADPGGDGFTGGLGSCFDEGVFVVSEVDGADATAGVVAGWPAGARGHRLDYSDSGKSLLPVTYRSSISAWTMP